MIIHNTNEMDDIHEDTFATDHPEADRVRQFFNEVLMMPIEWEPAFYIACWNYFEGTDSMPNILDYKEVD